MKFSSYPLRCHTLKMTIAGVLAFTGTGMLNAVAQATDLLPAELSAFQLSHEHTPAFQLRDFGRVAVTAPSAPAAEAPPPPRPAARFTNRRFAAIIDKAARSAALDPALVHAVIAVESAYNPAARSPKGAIGLMQVMPATARRYGVPDPASSPEANLRAGTRYLRHLMELFNNQLELVLAAYNAGENAVLRHGQRIPPFKETQLYVPAVLARYREWREAPQPAAPAPVLQEPQPSRPVRIQYMPGTRLETGSAYSIRESAGDAGWLQQR